MAGPRVSSSSVPPVVVLSRCRSCRCSALLFLGCGELGSSFLQSVVYEIEGCA